MFFSKLKEIRIVAADRRTTDESTFIIKTNGK